MREAQTRMLDELRYFRNQMLYSGKILDRDYADKVVKLTKAIYPNLMEAVKDI
jgi:hypothetical protein